MNYSRLVEIYERLESTQSKLEKTDVIANFLREVPEDLLGIVPPLIMGRVFPQWSQLELGIGPGLLYESISFVTGADEREIAEAIKEEGDVGLAAQRLFEKKVQTTFFTEGETSLKKFYETLEKIANTSGSGAQDRKIRLLSELLTNASPSEAKYIARTVLEELRVGVAEGLVRDAIAKAFDTTPPVVERAYMLTNDFGKVTMTAKRGGEAGLKSLAMEVGMPLKPMLAQLAPSIEDGLDKLGKAAVEIKYDGARVQIHKDNDGIKIYSRRLEDVTKPLPDIAGYARDALKAKKAIVEGEVVALDPNTKKPRAFQDILRRFRRKYDVEKMVEKIPFEVHLFDLLYLEGQAVIDEEFAERRKKMSGVVEPIEGKFVLAEQLVTEDPIEAEKFYNNALEMGHEGIMIKNLHAPYVPGARVGHMYKIKPQAETLDLVITGALWGIGKRAGWLSSYILGAREEEGGFLTVGRVGTGVTEEQLEEFTQMLKPLIEYESGGSVRLRPSVVVEVGYQEIQKSPKYDSGFALRFPRVIDMREDKSPQDADTLSRIRELYERQRG